MAGAAASWYVAALLASSSVAVDALVATKYAPAHSSPWTRSNTTVKDASIALASSLVDGALYNLDKLENNLDKLANLTIDELSSGNNVVRKEDSSDRPRETHHKLVVLFFIVSSTFLLVVMCMTAVFYSREKLDLGTAGYGSFGIAKQHKAGLLTALRGETPKDEETIQGNEEPPPATLYTQALMAHQAAIVAKDNRNKPSRRKTDSLPSIDEGNSVGYAPSDAGSDLETQSLSSQPGFSVAGQTDYLMSGTNRDFPRPPDHRW